MKSFALATSALGVRIETANMCYFEEMAGAARARDRRFAAVANTLR
jgi:hypothetical protein